MKIAVIGSGRKRNGIGEFIAKYLHQNGAEVACVLGSSPASASRAAANLERYGIRARSYSDLPAMLANESLDAAAVASPVETHLSYVQGCIDAGLHIFCEKPFMSPEVERPGAVLDDLFGKAEDRSLVIAMNSQWPFCLPFYEELCGVLNPAGMERFFIRLSPIASGREMIPDSMPHALSLLYAAAGSGEIRKLSFSGDDNTLVIYFSYLTQEAEIRSTVELVREIEQPRTFSFGFNERIVRRVIDPETYTIYLTHKSKTIKITDPLELSVLDFLHAVRSDREPAVGSEHIRKTASLLAEIYAAYKHA
jgi:predicted dehydrogenase